MHKWEYTELDLKLPVESQTDINAYILRPNGRHEEIKGRDPGAMIAQLGMDGWELIAVSTRPVVDMLGGDRFHITYNFKRLIEY